MASRSPAPLLEARSETVFSDYKPPLSAANAVAEANRCLYCSDAPCIKACPTGIDIPEFIRKISTGNVKGSARTILSSNILGMSCARVCPVEVLCEGDCVYNALDAPPIQIGRLQRFATDQAFDKDWTYFVAGPDSGFSVGLIGGGPASLAAAHELRRAGHAVTIYERDVRLGGLNVTGVAPHKMRADRAIEEIDRVLAIGGIDVQCGVTVGEELSWSDLESRHDALFLGVGLGPDRAQGIPGESLTGVYGAVAFIAALKLGTVSLEGVTAALVIGGGNTALDAVRELLGLGLPEVTLVYRKDEARMSGYEHEWNAAKKAGARAIWNALPAAYEGAGQLSGARLSLSGGGTLQVPAQLALVAIGQSRLVGLLSSLGLDLDGGRVVVDERGFTGRPGLWAGGDCANGGKEVVNAVAEGKRAALAIDAWLREQKGPKMGASHA